MHEIDYWIQTNFNVLVHLFKKLIVISNSNGIQLIDNQSSFDNFLYMMYKESSHSYIDKNLYPEFFS